MKVIGQLIRYFQSHGALSDDQVRYLVEHGFMMPPADWEGAVEEEPVSSGPPERTWNPPERDAEQDLHDRFTPSTRRGRGAIRHRSQLLEPEEITAWLDGQFADWEPALVGLQQVARRFHSVDSWTEAAAIIRQADRQSIRETLRSGLERQELSLGALWESLGFDGYQALVAARAWRGPAASAYRQILAAIDMTQAGRHAWLLRMPQVAAVFNLLSAQRRLAEAFGLVFEHDSPAVSAAMRRETHPLAYWSMLLMYNALRGPSPYGSLAQREYGPLVWLGDDLTHGMAVITLGEGGERCGPTFELWQRAWSMAMTMLPDAVTPYFAKSVNQDDPTLMMCPAGWHLK